MQIVVKIPDDMIKSLEQGNFGAKYNIYDLAGCLMNGTPLPKGHGRLIDADALNFNANYNEPLIHKQDIDFAPTILEGVKADAV